MEYIILLYTDLGLTHILYYIGQTTFPYFPVEFILRYVYLNP